MFEDLNPAWFSLRLLCHFLRHNQSPEAKKNRLLLFINTEKISFARMVKVAELQNAILYGLNRSCMHRKELIVQLHITAKCDQSCMHCYLHEDDYYKSLLTNELSANEFIHLIDDIIQYTNDRQCPAVLDITGGDPLLSNNFWDIIKTIRAKYPHVPISIMGNSYHIDSATAQALKKLGIWQYQISIDGLKETHDQIRRTGSFSDAIRALSVIHAEAITATVMFTVSRKNYKEFIPLYKYLDSLGIVDCLGLDRMTAIGKGKELENELLSAEEYRQFLFSVYKFISIEKPNLVVNIKDNLWKLLLYELGLTLPISTEEPEICSGCAAGKTLCVMPNGEVFSCPRIPISIGKYPEQTVEEIIEQNSLSPVIFSYSEYEGCNACVLLPYCRGCRAASYAASGNILTKDPNCWKE